MSMQSKNPMGLFLTITGFAEYSSLITIIILWQGVVMGTW